jgi:hypothetical protein
VVYRHRGATASSYRRPALNAVAVERARNSNIDPQARWRGEFDAAYVPRARKHFDGDRLKFRQDRVKLDAEMARAEPTGFAPGWRAAPRESPVERAILRMSALLLIIGAVGCFGLLYSLFQAPSEAPRSRISAQPPARAAAALIVAGGKGDLLAASTHARIDRAPANASPAPMPATKETIASAERNPRTRSIGPALAIAPGEAPAAVVARAWSVFEPDQPSAAERVQAARGNPPAALPVHLAAFNAPLPPVRPAISESPPVRSAAVEGASRPARPALAESASTPVRSAAVESASRPARPAVAESASPPLRAAVVENAPLPVRPAVAESASPPFRLASLETPPPQTGRPRIPPEMLSPHLPSSGEIKTELVAFDTAPFPYEGRVPGSDRPFLGTGESGHRGHANVRGRVLWESETFGDNHVLLHIPSGFDPGRPAVMVVFFHGHGAILGRDVRDRQKVPAQIAASGANAVLVAPQFAVDAADSSAGKFWEPGGFRRFLDEAAEHLARAYGDPRAVQTFANMPIVIVAYSGGYGPLLSVMARGEVKPSRVRGIVLLDALYSGMDKFANWIASNRSAFFVSSYTPHTRWRNVELEEMLTEHSVPYSSELRHNHLQGMVTFLPAGDVPHRDFVTHAWADNPIADILMRMEEFDPKVPVAMQPAVAPVAAAAVQIRTKTE